MRQRASLILSYKRNTPQQMVKDPRVKTQELQDMQQFLED